MYLFVCHYEKWPKLSFLAVGATYDVLYQFWDHSTAWYHQFEELLFLSLFDLMTFWWVQGPKYRFFDLKLAKELFQTTPGKVLVGLLTQKLYDYVLHILKLKFSRKTINYVFIIFSGGPSNSQQAENAPPPGSPVRLFLIKWNNTLLIQSKIMI